MADSWRQTLYRLKQRRRNSNTLEAEGAPFGGSITGSHQREKEQVTVTYHGGARSFPTPHPYVGTNSWIRAGVESGVDVVLANRPDTNAPELLSFIPKNLDNRITGFKNGVNVYRPLAPGEIEVASSGLGQSYYSQRPIKEDRAGLIRSWLNQDDLESGQKSPVHIRAGHLRKSNAIGDEERFGVVQRPGIGVLGPSTFLKSFITATGRAPDPALAAAYATTAATSGIVASPGPFAKEYMRILGTGAAIPDKLCDIREGDVIDDFGFPVLSPASGNPLRVKREYFTKTGSAFFFSIDDLGNFTVSLPTEAALGGDIQIPVGDLVLSIGKNYTNTVQVDYSLATTSGAMSFDAAANYSVVSQTGDLKFNPAAGTGKFDVGNADEPVVLGNKLIDFLTAFLDLFGKHDHVGNLGAPTPLNPAIIAEYLQLKTLHLDSGITLSDYANVSKLP